MSKSDKERLTEIVGKRVGVWTGAELVQDLLDAGVTLPKEPEPRWEADDGAVGARIIGPDKASLQCFTNERFDRALRDRVLKILCDHAARLNGRTQDVEWLAKELSASMVRAFDWNDVARRAIELLGPGLSPEQRAVIEAAKAWRESYSKPPTAYDAALDERLALGRAVDALKRAEGRA